MEHNPFHELTFYTLAYPDQVYFIHQHAVDAWTAQTATVQSKAIGIAFALAGLCHFLERGYTGRQVQQAHMALSRNKSSIPAIARPAFRGEVTIDHVLAVSPGKERDAQIRCWCHSVWSSFATVHPLIRTWLSRELEITF